MRPRLRFLSRRAPRRVPARLAGRSSPLRAGLAVSIVAGLATGLAAAPSAGAARAGRAGAAPATAAFPNPSWVDTVGPVALSSPVTGVIDGTPVVTFGSESGYLYVINARTGANLPGWPRPVDLAPHTPSAIESSPTIAYLHGPNKPPLIVVGAGSTYIRNQQGGLIAFHPNGSVAFRFRTLDIFNEWRPGGPDGYREGVFSTPAVGDVNGNGQLDLVFGSWDHRLYAINPTGKLVPGFPLDTEDTIWSSPALIHLRGSPRQEDILIGGDASGRNGCYGGFVTDYTYADGAPRIVWQHCENQTIWSSPAVGVINATGKPAVVVGTGFGERPPYKSDSYKLFAFYASSGVPVPGWPVATAGPSFGSPAIGVLPGSSTPAVVDTSWCTACKKTGHSRGESKVYAWAGSGKKLWSQTLNGPNDFSSPILVDLTGSGQNDVVVGSSAGMFPLSGADGSFLFGTSAHSGINTCSMLNSAAVADLPGSGPGSGWHLFEACGGPVQVTGTGTLFDYPLPARPGTTPPWSAWRDGPSHDGVATASFAAVPASAGLARRLARAERRLNPALRHR